MLRTTRTAASSILLLRKRSGRLAYQSALAEREMTALAERGPVDLEAIRYVNRLSDHLFVLARYLNKQGRGDPLWQPGAPR